MGHLALKSLTILPIRLHRVSFFTYLKVNLRVANIVFNKSLEIREALNVCVTEGHRSAKTHTLSPGTEGASWVEALFPFLSEVTEVFWKIESKFLSSRVLAGGIVMRCAKKSWFLAYIKSSRKICCVTKSLGSQTNVWTLANLVRFYKWMKLDYNSNLVDCKCVYSSAFN